MHVVFLIKKKNPNNNNTYGTFLDSMVYRRVFDPSSFALLCFALLFLQEKDFLAFFFTFPSTNLLLLSPQLYH
jgi:hypothetical protein